MMERNNIGFLRLVLASVVVIAHAIEFKTLKAQVFGGWSVDAFFIISGFLITRSAIASGTKDFFIKRFLRIFPAFALSYVLAGIFVGPLIDSHMDWRFWYILILKAPPSVSDSILSCLNMSMWTIAYEFRCYVVAGLLALWCGFENRFRIVLLTGFMLVLKIIMTLPAWKLYTYVAPNWIDVTIGQPVEIIRCLGTFGIGMSAYLYRTEVMDRLSFPVAVACLAIILSTIKVISLFVVALPLFGGMILFWLAFKVNLGWFQKINDRWDISYGTYLYGWPVGIALVKLIPTLSGGELIAYNLISAWALGVVSWFGFERFFKYRSKKH